MFFMMSLIRDDVPACLCKSQVQTRSIGPASLTAAAAANVAHLQPSAPPSLSRRARPQPTTSVVTYRATANSRLIAGSRVGASIRHYNVEAVAYKDNFNLTATVCFRHRLATSTSRRGEESDPKDSVTPSINIRRHRRPLLWSPQHVIGTKAWLFPWPFSPPSPPLLSNNSIN
ncbi:unnamed protein product [Caenorhabditis brenneri]